MKVIFTCGGTGGHIYPAIAVAKLLQQRQPGCEILFIGAEDGMENKIVPHEGFALETLKISNYQRSLTPKAIWHNCRTLCNMAGSLRKARKLIREFKPDVIVGTGGYASFPALREGAKLGVRTAVHESNAVPGLTTRMVEKLVDRVMVSFEESKSFYSNRDRVIVTGTPVREAFLFSDRHQARKELGLKEDEVLVVSCWGSLGAREMNKKIARFMKRACEDGQPFFHIHATGSFGWRWMPEFVAQQGVQLDACEKIQMCEYIYNMPQVMTAADLMICRAGAATLSEVAASATPCIIVPSPNVTDNHQEKNAQVLANSGAAIMLREAECDGDLLYETAKDLLHHQQKLRAMRKSLTDLAVVDAAERIYAVVTELARR